MSASATNANLSNRFTVIGRVPTETAKEMTVAEIKDTIKDHVHAAKCAIDAGFDCVEIVSIFRVCRAIDGADIMEMKTAGNGYLCNQFLNDKSNLRTDSYGGSVEKRARFTLELLDAVIAAIGNDRVAVRFSPFGIVLMELDSDPISAFTYILSEVEKRSIAYVCLTQPRTDLFLSEDAKWANLHKASDSSMILVKKEDINLRVFEEVLKTTPKLATGNYDAKNCFEEVEKGELDAITFGRWFISNPDLVERIRAGKDLAEWDMKTWYADGKEGYTDYLRV